jgi:ankyrin repeat protein
MHVYMKQLASLCLLLVLTGVGQMKAGGPDVRLVDAMAERNTALVRTLLGEGVDVNNTRADGATALLWAAHWDDADAAKRLLGVGARVNTADDHGVTPLARACENASEEMVGRLLEAGADPNAAQVNGLTPLMTAARTGNVDIVRALLLSGADMNAATAVTQETALTWAVAARRVEMVRLLVDNGADVHPNSGQAFSPLMAAARNGDIESATVLLAAGARVNERAADGTHPLPYAIVVGESAFAHFLLEQGADPNGTIDGTTALHAAAGPVDTWLNMWSRRHGGGGARHYRLTTDERLALVKALFDRGADPNPRMTASEMPGLGFLRNGSYDNFGTGTGDVAGATPVWVAAYATNPGHGSASNRYRNIKPMSSGDVLRALLAAGARLDITTADGTTPLMAAAGCGRAAHIKNAPRSFRQSVAEDAVRVLLEAGADVNVRNEGDFTALHCAAFSGLPELVRLFVSNGADINARDWRGRTPFRLAQGAKQSFHYQAWPAVAVLLQELGADTSLGIPGTIHERLRGLVAATDDR